MSACAGAFSAGSQIGLSLNETRPGESVVGGLAVASLAGVGETRQRGAKRSGTHCPAAECVAWESARCPVLVRRDGPPPKPGKYASLNTRPILFPGKTRTAAPLSLACVETWLGTAAEGGYFVFGFLKRGDQAASWRLRQILIRDGHRIDADVLIRDSSKAANDVAREKP